MKTVDGEVPYDHVVIAPGSVTNDFGIPGVKEHALVVKWLEDGRAVRHRILSTFEDAALLDDAARRRELLSFAIVGAGPVGVELAASMRDLMDHTLRGIYPTSTCVTSRRSPSSMAPTASCRQWTRASPPSRSAASISSACEPC